ARDPSSAPASTRGSERAIARMVDRMWSRSLTVNTSAFASQDGQDPSLIECRGEPPPRAHCKGVISAQLVKDAHHHPPDVVATASSGGNRSDEEIQALLVVAGVQRFK